MTKKIQIAHTSYYGSSVWKNTVNEEEVKLTGNFNCTVDGIAALCIMAPRKGGGGHGEGTWTEYHPTFVNADTLQTIPEKKYPDKLKVEVEYSE